MLKVEILCLFRISIKRLSGKKDVMVLTNIYYSVRVARDERWKPDVHVLYGHAKGGGDVVDLSSSHHSTRKKRKRWPVNALASLVNTVRTNAKTVLAESTSKVQVSSLHTKLMVKIKKAVAMCV